MASQYTFILIDDSKLDIFIHERLVKISGLSTSIITFNSAIAALEYLSSEGLQLTETVILLDLQLPDMNGMEFIEHYSQLPNSIKSNIKIYMLSSTVDPGDIQKANSNPYIKNILSKPLSIEVLKKELE